MTPALVEVVASIQCQSSTTSFTKDGETSGLVLGDDGDHVGTGGGADDEGHVGGESERAGTSHLKMMMTGMMVKKDEDGLDGDDDVDEDGLLPHRLLLHLLRLCSWVTLWSGHSSGEKTALVLGDDVTVLGVHLEQGWGENGGFVHSAQERRVQNDQG